MRKIAPFLICIVFLIAGCGPEPTAVVPQGFLGEIVGNGQNHFRGLSIGDSFDDVMELEKAQPKIVEDENYAVFEYPIGNNEQYAVSYSIDDDGLYDIEVGIDLKDKASANSFYKDLQDYFTKKFGDPSASSEKLTSWLIVDSDDSEIEISVHNVVEGYENGHLDITIFAFGNS